MASAGDIESTTSGQYDSGAPVPGNATQRNTGADALSGYRQPDGTYHIPSSITSDGKQWLQLVYQLRQAGVPLDQIYGQKPDGSYQQAQHGDEVGAQAVATGSIDHPDGGGIANGSVGVTGPDAGSYQSGGAAFGDTPKPGNPLDERKALLDALGIPDTAKALQSLGGGGSGSSDIVNAVNKVAGEAQGYATQNRDFQLTGLDKSNQAFDPAKQSYAGMYGPGGTQTGPGQGEQAFSQTGGHLLDPSAQSGVLGQTAGFLGGQSPGMSALGQVAGQLGGPTLSSQQYGNYSSQLAAPSNLQQGYGQFSSTLAAPSAGEQRYSQTQGQYDSNPLQQEMGSLNAKYDAPTNLQSSLGSIQAGYQKPSNAQGSYATSQQQLSGPGALEQFAASDLNGTNPYYKQLQDTQAANIDAEFNARGGYNSGAAMKAQAIGASNLTAQQYQQEGQLQGQAQTAQTQRLGQLQSGASSADSSNYAALSGQTGALSAADAQRLAATNGQVGLAGAASGMNLSYLQGGQNAADSAGAAGLARTQAGIGLASSTDANNLARTQAGINLTQGTDATNLAQNLGYVGAADAAGAGQTSQYSTYGNIAQGLDATTQAQLNAYLNQADAAQGLSQGREQQGFSDAAGLGAQQAGNTLTAYGNAGNQYASMIDASLGAQLNAAQLQAQQNAQSQQNALGYAGLLTKVLTA